MESFRAALPPGHHEVYHHFSPKHLDRYVREFQRRNNIRRAVATMTARAVEKHLPHASLIGPERTRQPSML